MKKSSQRTRAGAAERAAARRRSRDWYSAKFRSFDEMEAADLEEAALMAPEERLRLVFLLSGQLAQTDAVPREQWPTGTERFGADPE